MFWHYKYGLVTSHTEAQWNALKQGDGFAATSFSVCLDIAWHLEAGKPYSTYPERKITREQAGMILARYKAGEL